MRELVKKAQPATEYYFKQYLGGFEFASIADKKQKIRLVLAKLKNISSPVERSHWLRELAERSNTEERVLAEEMDVLPVARLSDGQGQASSLPTPVLAAHNRKSLIAERIFSLALAAEQLPLLKETVEYFPADIRLVYDYFLNPSGTPPPKELIDSIHLRAGFEFDGATPEKIKAEMSELILNLRGEHFKEKQKEISERVKKLTDEGKENELAAVIAELDNISKKIHNI